MNENALEERMKKAQGQAPTMAMAFQEKIKFKIIGLGDSKDSKKNND